MKVFRLSNDVNRHQYFLTENEEDEDKFEMDCVPKAEIWSPPSVFIYKPFHKPGALYNFGGGLLITSPPATEVLRTFLEMAGELLPLPYRGQTYAVLNVTECINCLDQEKTEWVKGETTGENIEIQKYVFHRNRFSESRIFKIPETHVSEVLVVEWEEESADEVRYTAKQTGLQGMIFQLLWEG